MLLDEEKAIVSQYAGTTRDIVEGKLNIGNITLNLIDTAGIRESGDFVEQIGISKAKEVLKQAELILLVLDNNGEIILINDSALNIFKMSYDNASNQRKQQLACALKEMLQTKPLSKISVSDLIRHCNINRKTFYYHFEDIFSLLEWTLQQETIELLKRYNIFTDYNNAIGFVIDYVETNYSMLSNIYNSMGHHQLQLFFSQNVIILVYLVQASCNIRTVVPKLSGR